MTNTFSIYLLTRLTAVQGLFITLTIITALCTLGYTIWYFTLHDTWDDSKPDPIKLKKAKVNGKTWAVISITLSIFSILIPDTKEAMIIIAGGKTLDYVQKDTSLQKIPYKATELILHKMEEYMKEDKK